MPEVRIVPFPKFYKFYTLVRRLSDLLALQQRRGYDVTSNGDAATSIQHSVKLVAECAICLDETPSSIFPRGHCVCESCERKWVRRHLTCPFCRAKFSSVQDIRNNAWLLSEFSAIGLDIDVAHLYSQINIFWKSCDYRVGRESLSSYEQADRSVAVELEEEEDFVIASACPRGNRKKLV